MSKEISNMSLLYTVGYLTSLINAILQSYVGNFSAVIAWIACILWVSAYEIMRQKANDPPIIR